MDGQSELKSGEVTPRADAWVRPAVLIAMGIGIGFFYWQFSEALSLRYWAGKEEELRAYQQQHPWWVLGAAGWIYVVATGLSLPGATALTLLYAWYFGFGTALVLVSFASTAGATMAFVLSRFLFRDAVMKRFGDRVAFFNASLEREGPFFLFTLRLIPLVPFFVINAVMGMTPISVVAFWWVSQLGMLPGTIVYVYAGSRVPHLQTVAEHGLEAIFTPGQLFQITAALTLLGVFPLLVRYGLKLLRPPQG